MSTPYTKHFSTRQTPQTEAIPGKAMVQNSAGAYAFALDDWARLDRFLCLGNEGGTYYVTEKKLTVENAQCVLRCLKEDGQRAVARIVEISEAGRAPKNDPAIFALALATSHGDAATKASAYAALPRVCRIPTHLFAFVAAVKAHRGWGRGLRRAIGGWYTSREPRDLAYQVCKYQSRDGWSHSDLLRLCHVRSDDPAVQSVLRWVRYGADGLGPLTVTRKLSSGEHVSEYPAVSAPLPDPIVALEAARKATTAAEIVRLIREYDLVRECVPTQFLTDPGVWEALLEKMPLTAMLRNLATMTRVGLLAPMSAAVRTVCARLADEAHLKKARVHPIAVLSALKTYQQGHGERGQNTWNPVVQVVNALDGAFYLAFGATEPTGKRHLLALDVSGSMSSGTIAGVPGLTPRVATAALSLVTANVEPQHAFVKFDHGIQPLSISPRQRLDDVMRTTSQWEGGGTDCALPMLHAAEVKMPVDAFVILTDNESWAGKVHASQALEMYRQKMGIPARAICVGMTATNFSVLDGQDAGSLNVVGFDTAVPQLMSQFVAD